MCNCIANHTMKRKRIRCSTYSIPSTMYHRHGRITMPIVILMMFVFCSVSSLPLATHPYYNPRRRRRNNTGFYYGLLDDHIIYGINSHYNNCQTSSTVTLQSLCDKLMSNHNISTLRQKLSLRLEALAVFKHHQQISIPTTISSSLIRGGSIVHSVSTKQRPKPKQKGRKRKNNTGFYYGIRDDILSYVEEDIGVQELPISSKKDKQRSPPQHSKKKKSKSSTLSQSPKANSNNNKVNKKRHKDKSNIFSPQDMSKFDSTDTGMSTILSETLYELRSMRQEIEALRGELSALKGKQGKLADQQDEVELFDNSDIIAEDYDDDYEHPSSQSATKRAKLEQIGKDVEKWATRLLLSDEDDETAAATGWKEILCNKMVRKKFNKLDRTKVYLKWMPDSRDEEDVESLCSPTPNQDYPCLKCYSTIDAPLDTVCSFLSNPDTIPLYNELVVDHCDVEEITPSSKITWCKMPKVLFVKPRDFVTYCSHRWRSDGTQVIVNQACEHDDMPGVMKEGQGSACRGFALRGANFISKDPDDPNHKTRITMLSHANPGGGLPQWAMNTAVNGVVQVEPFKFFHNINESICNYQETAKAQSKMSTVGSSKGRSKKPAGIAHLGFTCFWPNGGGLREGGNTYTNHLQQDIWTEDDDYNDDDDDYEDYDS